MFMVCNDDFICGFKIQAQNHHIQPHGRIISETDIILAHGQKPGNSLAVIMLVLAKYLICLIKICRIACPLINVFS